MTFNNFLKWLNFEKDFEELVAIEVKSEMYSASETKVNEIDKFKMEIMEMSSSAINKGHSEVLRLGS